MRFDQERSYDSFVVRVWRQADGDALLRVEVEHIQDGATVRATGVAPEWIVTTIGRWLTDRPAAEDERRATGFISSSDP